MPSTTYHVPGPCTITYGGQGLGVTKSGVTLNARTNMIPITDDAHGAEPADYIFAGKSATVTIIGMNMSALLACNFWDGTDQLLARKGITDIGNLMSAVASALIITETDSSIWQANKAIPVDPETMQLVSTIELQVPLMFLIIPDDNDKLFVTVGSYLDAG